TSSTMSLVNDSQGVSLMASPKQPQSVTLLKYAEKKVRKVKKTIMASSNHSTSFSFQRISSATPSTITAALRKMDRNSAAGTSDKNTGEKSWANTSKYSSSLMAVPTGSLILIMPEKMKRTPT